MKALVNGRLILPDGLYTDRVLLMDKKIRGIIAANAFDDGSVREIINVRGQYISPGFIDVHIHGSGGCDTMDGDIEALRTISKTIMKYGTTGFLPTTMTMKLETIYRALNTVREALSADDMGAAILGAHLEGPFINKQYKGAQKEDDILKPQYDYIKDYLDIIRIITLAPEVEGSRGFIKEIKEKSSFPVLSIGHTAATYEEAMAAIESGISHCTHLFNAMTPLHHRNPGVVGAVFNSSISCELIADKIHLHPELFKLLLRIKGEDRLVLVTDAMRAGCMKDGCYDLGGQKVTVREGRAQLANGNLAGSVLTLNKAVKNFLETTGIPIHQVIKLVSQNPARLIGMADSKGSIEIGKDADVLVFDDNIDVKQVFIEGSCRIGGSYAGII